MSPQERKLRAELAWLQSRYDCGQVSPALYAVIKELESQIAWLAYRRIRDVERITGGPL